MPKKPTKKKGSQRPSAPEIKPEDAKYMDSSVLDYSFSDFVRIKSFPQGMLFSFAKRHPEQPKAPLIFKEILLPFSVAERLSIIIKGQFEKLEKEGLIVRVEPPKEEKQK